MRACFKLHGYGLAPQHSGYGKLFGDFPDGDAVGKVPKLDAVFEYREAIRLAVACVKSDLEHDAALDERCDLVNGAAGKWGYGKLQCYDAIGKDTSVIAARSHGDF